jgi:hypothetical protein
MPLRHVVVFRLQPDTPAEPVEHLVRSLRELAATLPEIVDYRVGTDLGVNDASWDLAVTADFADEAGYLAYRDHPEHQAIIRDQVTPIVAERASVQFAT